MEAEPRKKRSGSRCPTVVPGSGILNFFHVRLIVAVSFDVSSLRNSRGLRVLLARMTILPNGLFLGFFVLLNEVRPGKICCVTCVGLKDTGRRMKDDK